jgi:hypothetical protein
VSRGIALGEQWLGVTGCWAEDSGGVGEYLKTSAGEQRHAHMSSQACP